MVTVYRPGVDRHLVATADFPQQFSGALPYIPNQHRVSIFGHPYDMIFAIPYVWLPDFAVCIIGGCYCIPSPKGEGFTDPKKGTLKLAKVKLRRFELLTVVLPTFEGRPGNTVPGRT